MLIMFKNLPADDVAHERKPAGGKSKNNQPGQIDFNKVPVLSKLKNYTFYTASSYPVSKWEIFFLIFTSGYLSAKHI